MDYEIFKFEPIIINCAEFDADLILAKLKNQAEKGEPLNELELIYRPMFKSENIIRRIAHRVNPAISVTKIEDEQKLKVPALAIVLSNKVVDADKLEELWRELKMLRHGKILNEIVEGTALEEKQIVELASQHGLEVKK